MRIQSATAEPYLLTRRATIRRVREILRHDFTRPSALTSRTEPFFAFLRVMQGFLTAQIQLPGQLVIFL